MDTSTVTDSTDWLSTPLSGLAPLESSLRCQVCKDFFTTPMITSCSHTFCSLCIRRYLSQEGRCPACREPDQEMKLRRNWVVEELVVNFKASRNDILGFVHEAMKVSQDTAAGEGRQAKRRKVMDTKDSVNGVAPKRRSTRSQTKRASQATASQRSPVSTQNEIADSDTGSVYEDEPSTSRHFDGPAELEPNDGLVACPSCSRRMKESLVNSHLDKCLAGEVPPPTPPSNDKTSTQSSRPPHMVSGTIAYTQTKPSTSSRLATLNYSLLNDNSMRKRLKELGIPHDGSKELMRKRHMEWLNLWNANCDSLNPVSKHHLLKSLSSWERTLGRQIAREQQGPNGVMVKDFDRDRYVKTQRSEFDDLIAKARQNQAAKKAEAKKSLDQVCSQEEAGPSVPGQGDGSDEHHGNCIPLESFSAQEASLEEDSSCPDLQVDQQIPSMRAPDPITTPDFDWMSNQNSDINHSEASKQPPPSSQRSMSHDITA